MIYPLDTIANTFLFREIRKNISTLIVMISLIALSAIYIYRRLINPPKELQLDLMTAKTVRHFTRINQEALRDRFYLTKFLLHGPSGDRQEAIARKMAWDLGLTFHCFDGREMKKDMNRWNALMQRLSRSKAPEFVFVSHADTFCQSNSISSILVHTGSVSKTLLLCLGFTSIDGLDPAIASRYRERLYIPASTIEA